MDKDMTGLLQSGSAGILSAPWSSIEYNDLFRVIELQWRQASIERRDLCRAYMSQLLVNTLQRQPGIRSLVFRVMASYSESLEDSLPFIRVEVDEINALAASDDYDRDLWTIADVLDQQVYMLMAACGYDIELAEINRKRNKEVLATVTLDCAALMSVANDPTRTFGDLVQAVMAGVVIPPGSILVDTENPDADTPQATCPAPEQMPASA